MRVVVIGAGVSGLTSAYRISQVAPKGTEIVVLEAAEQVGGKIQTAHLDGYAVESGPNGFLDSKPATLELVRELGMESSLLKADEASRKRFLFLGGHLEELPTSPLKFFTSSVLPLRGRLRFLLEPFQGKGPADETLGEFGRRRLGRHAVERLLDPFVAGIFAGDVEQLSVAAAFPRVKALESEYGSLIKGMRARAKAKKLSGAGGAAGPGGELHSLRAGLGELIEVLHRECGARVRTGVPVESVRAGENGRYEVLVPGERIEANFVVSASPAPAAAKYLGDLAPDIARLLADTPYASVAVVATGFEQNRLGHDLDGFGFLVPSGEDRRILGSLWASSIYPGHRAPADHVLLRTLVGGVRHPEFVELDDTALLTLVGEELSAALGVAWVEPDFVRIVRWKEAIPQYVVGHLDRMRRIESSLLRHPGLVLTGNHLYGVSLNDCVADAKRVAKQFSAWLDGPVF